MTCNEGNRNLLILNISQDARLLLLAASSLPAMIRQFQIENVVADGLRLQLRAVGRLAQVAMEARANEVLNATCSSHYIAPRFPQVAIAK